MKNKKEKSPVRKTIALAGNPNSGKTTLFNLLTKSHQHIGNWPGVTVERKEGRYFKDTSLKIVDLPGIYSLTPLSVDEEVAHNYINNDRPDLIIDVVDSTNLERNLFLTSQLLELDIPVVVALNMEDEARAKGIGIDGAALEKVFGCPFFPFPPPKIRRRRAYELLRQRGNKKRVCAHLFCRRGKRAGQNFKSRENSRQQALDFA